MFFKTTKFRRLILAALMLNLVLFPVAHAASLPDIPGANPPGQNASFAELINYIFALLLWIGILLVAASLIYAGVVFLVSAGNTLQVSQAKSQIFYSVMGLLILLSSFLLLNTINSQLVSFPWNKPPPIPTPTSSIPFPTTTTPSPASAATFQEIPIGTLTEKILAKDTGCYRDGDINNEMVDCQDRKAVDSLVNQYDARIGYCYDFDQDQTPGDFKDAATNTPDTIDPMTEHDRFDCLLKLRKAIRPRIQKLKELANRLKELTNKCNCKKCKKKGKCKPGECPCPPGLPGECGAYNDQCETPKSKCKCVKSGTSQQCEQKGDAECCVGKPRGKNDPCGKKLRKKIDILRKHALKREYTDKELKKMSVEDFQKLVGTKNSSSKEGFQGYRYKGSTKSKPKKDDILVADQLRYLQINFLRPSKKDLQHDLTYLRKAENFLKNKCPYKAITSHAIHYYWEDTHPSIEWKEKKFCESSMISALTGICPNKVDISQYCKEFNCEDCTGKSGEKLPCYECNLDNLEQGDCATSTLGEKAIETCKCSGYSLNNQIGTSTCTTTDPTCTMCKIEATTSTSTTSGGNATSSHKMCEESTGDPATFYCPISNQDKTPQNYTALMKKNSIDPRPNSRFPKGLIPIGRTVDGTEKLGQLVLNKLKQIDQTITGAVEAVYLPSKKDNKKKQPNVLHFLPEGCMCNPNPDKIWKVNHCTTPLNNISCNVCHTYEECTNAACTTTKTVEDAWKCECGNCKKCVNKPHPCPMAKIRAKVSRIGAAFQTITSAFPRIEDLVEVRNLKSEDPNRYNLITMLSNSRKKMRECVPGFQEMEKGKMALRSVASCKEIWSLINTKKITVAPKFPIENYEGCYPPELSIHNYNEAENCYPYYSEALSSQDRETCFQNRSLEQCQQAIQRIGQNGGLSNFFCVSKNLK